jgi:hypothetical protein
MDFGGPGEFGHFFDPTEKVIVLTEGNCGIAGTYAGGTHAERCPPGYVKRLIAAMRIRTAARAFLAQSL